MGACGRAAVVVLLLLASALRPAPASASGRSLREGENPNSGEDSPAPNVSGQQAESTQHQKSPPPPPPKDTKEGGEAQASASPPPSTQHQKSPPPPPTKDTKEGGEAHASASPPPPPPTQEANPQKAASPPPGVPGPNGGTGQEDSQGRREDTDKLKKAMEKCDVSHKCSSGKEFSACLHVSDNDSVGSYIIVQNEGQHDIDVNVTKPSSNINIDKKPLHVIKGGFGLMNIKYNSYIGNITLSDGKEDDCVIHVGQSVSNLQQQFQQVAAYAMRLNPIYGASVFGFTIVLIGAVCACCKFAKRRGNDAVPYQQIEMGGQAPNSSGVDNTASTTDGWEEGWDDDWDDEEAPAGPADKKPTSSVSANGLSLRAQTQTNSKDGWDVDWDD